MHIRTFLKLLSLSLFLIPNSTFAATFSVSPSPLTLSQGQTATLTIRAVSTDQVINAVSGTVTLPDTLSVVSVAKGNSIINFWTQEPSAVGNIVSFEGAILNPGYQGAGAPLVTITVAGKRAGTGAITFTSGSILANDGNGTNVLTSLPTILETVTPGSPQAAAPAAASAPTITSSTHPDQAKWYGATHVALDWVNDPAATAVRIGYDTDPQAQPSVAYTPVISHKELDLPEGVSYFSVQEKTADGWGAIGRFKIQIDTTPPLPMTLQFPHGATTTDARPTALFATTDKLSSVDHYDVFIQNNGPLSISSATLGNSPYVLPQQDPGVSSLRVTAYDKAGNATSVSGVFEVLGFDAPKLNPIHDINSGDHLEISGTTLPGAHVTAYLSGNDGIPDSEQATAQDDGSFRILWSKGISSGVYSLTLQAIDTNGAKSFKTPGYRFAVKGAEFLTFGWLVLNYFSLTVLLLIAAWAVILVGWYLWTHFHRFRRNTLSKMDQEHLIFDKQFNALKDAVRVEITALEKARSKRELTKEETLAIKRLQEMLEKSKEVIEKKMDSLRST